MNTMEREQLPDHAVRGWSWLQVVVVAIVAIIVACYFYKSSSKQPFYPCMKYNSTTLYPTLYISDDEKIITNRPTTYTNRVTSGPSHLHRYTGVILYEPISAETKTVIEVNVSYKVVNHQSGNFLLFEIGFSELDQLEKWLHLTQTQGTIAVRATTCHGQQHVCLEAFNGKNVQPSHIISEAVTSMTHQLRLRFQIDAAEDILKVFYSLENEPFDEIYTFVDANFKSEKWPVFGIYNPHMYEVHMKLHESEITDVKKFNSTTVHPMIYISDDELELSNVPTETTYRKSYRDGQLQRYEGVIANLSIDANNALLYDWPRIIQFHVNVEYTVTGFVSTNYLFEIGMCRRKYIDNHWSVGPQLAALSVYGSACTGTNIQEICLVALKDGIRTLVYKLSSSAAGTHFKGVITFSINIIDKQVTVTVGYRSYVYLNSEKSFVFDNVDFSEPLWPVFALYKHSIDTSFTLNKFN